MTTFTMTAIGAPPSPETDVQWIKSADGLFMPVWPKDYRDVISYGIDWTPLLAEGDTLISVRHILPNNDMYLLSENLTDFKTFLWVSGGTLLNVYYNTVHVVSKYGNQLNRTFGFMIVQN